PGREKPALPIAEIRKLHEAGDYRTALQEAARAIRWGEEPKGNDKFELQLIRGDCLLNLEDHPSALIAYEAAAKSPDVNVATEARGTAFLIRHSQDMKYTPKQGGDPISIADNASRKRAASALLTDQLAADRRELEAALKAQTLEPILKVVQPILTLRALEFVATGQGTETASLAQPIGERARDLIDAELRRIDNRTRQLQTLANQIPDDGTRRGLFSKDRNELRGSVAYLERILETSKQAEHLAQLSGGTPEKWAQTIADTQNVLQHATNVLAAD
ncbi:MAG: hypothetical protein WBD40_19710, partial [Tepidisphaeraceae bacterium]